MNDSTSASTSFNNATPTNGGTTTAKRPEVGVAEAWTNQRKRRESSERGNNDIIFMINLFMSIDRGSTFGMSILSS